ncbi:hypothetical protein FF80_02032 [Devosia sp. LC5]|uniref:hypothetical protein n=1 Tax=Devosia sp. LC5 TaxID=1502724 RepID=UPI0004E38B80|nr:hypothetical protein [Devosia sp. LC5]KFC68091.1 hypothetical protein FF80_02032 [Devosia sp. LC5]
MGKTLVLALAILWGAAAVAGAIVLRPTGFGQCVDIVGEDIARSASPGATLDPLDVEAEAARVCAGAVG